MSCKHLYFSSFRASYYHFHILAAPLARWRCQIWGWGEWAGFCLLWPSVVCFAPVWSLSLQNTLKNTANEQFSWWLGSPQHSFLLRSLLPLFGEIASKSYFFRYITLKCVHYAYFGLTKIFVIHLHDTSLLRASSLWQETFKNHLVLTAQPRCIFEIWPRRRRGQTGALLPGPHTTHDVSPM